METFKEEVIIEPFDNRSEIATRSNEFLGFAQLQFGDKITNDVLYNRAAEELRRVKKFVKDTEAQCRPRIKQVANLKQSLLDDMKLLLESANKSIPILSGLLVDYDRVLAKRREEQLARIESERVKQNIDARVSSDERRLERALELEKAGHKDLADSILNETSNPSPNPLELVPEPEKPSGLHFRKTWKAEMTADNIEGVDKRFRKEVFDQDVADAYAKSNKHGARAKGVRFYCKTTAVSS